MLKRFAIFASVVALALCFGCTSDAPGQPSSDASGASSSGDGLRYVGLGHGEDSARDSDIGKLYREKARELVDEYGWPEVRNLGNGPSAVGLAYASLKDFGAGEYLVTLCAEAAGAGAEVSTKRPASDLDIWAYDTQTGELASLFHDRVDASLSFNEIDGATRLLGASDDPSRAENPGDDVQVYTLRGAGEDGSIVVTGELVRVVSSERDPGTQSRRDDAYEVNGRQASADEWQSAMDRRNDGAVTYHLGADADASLPQATVDEAWAALESLGVRDEYRKRQEMFASKLGEYVERYGWPKARRGEHGAYLSGVAFAKRVHLGAGRDCLAVAYLDPGAAAASRPEGTGHEYAFELWGVGADASSLELAYSGRAADDGQNSFCAAVMATELDGAWYFIQRVDRENLPPTQVFYGLKGDGSIGACEEVAPSYPDGYQISRLGALYTTDRSVEPTLGETEGFLEGLGLEKPVEEKADAATVADGFYSATLPRNPSYAQYSPTTAPEVSSVRIDGDELTFSGSMRYSPERKISASDEGRQLVGPMDWALAVDGDTDYNLYGGQGGPQPTTREEFAQYASTLYAMGFGFEVRDGVVVELYMSS